MKRKKGKRCGAGGFEWLLRFFMLANIRFPIAMLNDTGGKGCWFFWKIIRPAAKSGHGIQFKTRETV